MWIGAKLGLREGFKRTEYRLFLPIICMFADIKTVVSLLTCGPSREELQPPTPAVLSVVMDSYRVHKRGVSSGTICFRLR